MKQKLKQVAMIAIAAFTLMPIFLFSQDSASSRTRTIQFGFVTPLSTNGLNSWHVVNKFSLNILAGYAGGLDGLELTGLASVLKEDMDGSQFAGIANIVLGNTKGVQFAGLTNVSLGKVKSAQFAGLANINTGPGKGFMTAGLVNISTSRLTGTQLSGLFNYAGKLKGVQLGVFNYTDSLERGIPIGFLSFVRNGYTAIEVGTTETLYGVMSFKTGTRQFYNILSAGGGYRNGLSLFAWGYGLGAYLPLGERSGISIDGICYQVNEGEWFTNRLNLLNKLNLTASWKFAGQFAVFGGISWNVTVADITDEYGDEVISHIAPWHVFNETYNDHLNVKMYPGFSAGIRL